MNLKNLAIIPDYTNQSINVAEVKKFLEWFDSLPEKLLTMPGIIPIELNLSHRTYAFLIEEGYNIVYDQTKSRYWINVVESFNAVEDLK